MVYGSRLLTALMFAFGEGFFLYQTWSANAGLMNGSNAMTFIMFLNASIWERISVPLLLHKERPHLLHEGRAPWVYG
jgi:hypothetical protein